MTTAPAEIVYTNGIVRTMDTACPLGQAVAISGGRVRAVGTNGSILALAGSRTRCIDAGGDCILPGFNDAHVHIWKVGQLQSFVFDARGADSLDRLLDEWRSWDAGRGHPWARARGYNEAGLQEGRHPNRADLDRVFLDRPAVLMRTCAHMLVANSAALRTACITATTPDPPGGLIDRTEAGEPTGLLRETAMGLVERVVPPPSTADYAAMIRAGQQHLLANGITSATDPAVHPELMTAYRSLDREERLAGRVFTLAIRRPDGGTGTLPLPEVHVAPNLRTDGVKFFADGGLSGATAALLEPYAHADTRGVLRFAEEELFELALPAHVAGLRIGIHAIGDAAIDVVLRVYDRLYDHAPGRRHRIEHCGLPLARHLDRMSRLGIFAVPQATFIRELGPNFRRYLTPGYLRRVYPLRSLLDAGIDTALSSDAPVVRDLDPLRAIQAAVLRRDEEGEQIAAQEAISVAEALRSYTAGGALASGDEGHLGRLTPGYTADMVRLSADPVTTPPEELHEIRVHETILGGRTVWQA